MSAPAILEDASACGVDLSLDGDRIALKAKAKPPDELLAEIARYRDEIILYLQGTAEYEAAEAEYQRQLAELRAANAKVCANPMPWVRK